MPHCVAWSECSGNTISVRDTRFHCIDRFACLPNYLSFVRDVIINADEIIACLTLYMVSGNPQPNRVLTARRRHEEND